MNTTALLSVAGGNLAFIGMALFYIRYLRGLINQHALQAEQKERELKRRVLELQVLRSLGERVGYSLDLHKTLEVITDSLSGLVDFATVSYMTAGSEGRIILKNRVEKPVSRQFLDQVKQQMMTAFSLMTDQKLETGLIDETVSGSSLDDSLRTTVGSFFNLPLSINNRVVALINVSSPQAGLYGDEETTILYTILDQVSAQASKLSQVIENEKRRLSAMVSSLADGILMVNSALSVAVANPALVRLVGAGKVAGQVSADDNSGISFYDVVAAVGSKANLQAAVQQAMVEQKPLQLPEFELNGWAVQVAVEPVKDKFGYLLGAAVVFHDVTAARQLERLREDFTAMMVHELRTPLTVISYSSQEMLDDASHLQPEEITKNISIIKDTSAQMLTLVNQLLDVARIESGKFEVIKQEGDLKQLIDNTVVFFRPLAEQKHLGLSAEVGENLTRASFDKVRLGQAINNLVSNALKYTDSGSITISAKLDSGMIKLTVADTGDGIKTEDLPKLFSKFEQLGKGKTGERSGTGLGLVVTKGIVEAHGGTITAASAGPGKGTTFTIDLPGPVSATNASGSLSLNNPLAA